jgi:hypothetical protein
MLSTGDVVLAELARSRLHGYSEQLKETLRFHKTIDCISCVNYLRRAFDKRHLLSFVHACVHYSVLFVLYLIRSSDIT